MKIRVFVDYFRRFHSKELADDYRRYLFETCTIVFSEEVKNKLDNYRGLIKEKDLEQLVVVKEPPFCPEP